MSELTRTPSILNPVSLLCYTTASIMPEAAMATALGLYLTFAVSWVVKAETFLGRHPVPAVVLLI